MTKEAATRAEPEKAHGAESDPLHEVLRVLREGERFLVCSHARPDGDAVGSMLALGMVLGQMGKKADLVTADQVPVLYRRLPDAENIRSAAELRGPYDAAILLECDSMERAGIEGLEDLFLVNIDHHFSGRPYAQLNWIDCDAASVGELVYRVAMAAGVTLTPQMAACLYTTILTDTGSFSYGALSVRTFALAQELVLAGADPIALAQDVYYSVPASKVVLLGAALQTLEREGRLAWLWITLEDMARAAALEEDCEGIVNFALSIAGVEAAVFLRELPDRQVRLSLRSKSKVNVAEIAEGLGGGGHENAAGCTLAGPLDRARDEILARLRPAVAGL
ncbi:MAG TPA: bifunctional oligoribonuclease/PAP phosphatase NrnA [Terracidiphilus sp.]|nr:bifunctional oligoribonuclease/PAP phosphatase NrnA [Terracidiphilus sp.]